MFHSDRNTRAQRLRKDLWFWVLGIYIYIYPYMRSFATNKLLLKITFLITWWKCNICSYLGVAYADELGFPSIRGWIIACIKGLYLRTHLISVIFSPSGNMTLRWSHFRAGNFLGLGIGIFMSFITGNGIVLMQLGMGKRF